jgi:hypothetical protein
MEFPGGSYKDRDVAQVKEERRRAARIDSEPFSR